MIIGGLGNQVNQTTDYYGGQRFFPDSLSVRDAILKEFTDIVVTKLHINNLLLVAEEHSRHFSYEAKFEEGEKVFQCFKTNFLGPDVIHSARLLKEFTARQRSVEGLFLSNNDTSEPPQVC